MCVRCESVNSCAHVCMCSRPEHISSASSVDRRRVADQHTLLALDFNLCNSKNDNIFRKAISLACARVHVCIDVDEYDVAKSQVRAILLRTKNEREKTKYDFWFGTGCPPLFAFHALAVRPSTTLVHLFLFPCHQQFAVCDTATTNVRCTRTHNWLTVPRTSLRSHAASLEFLIF